MENEKTFGRFLISKRQENEISARQLAIALDYALSVIEHPSGKKKPYALYQAEKQCLPTASLSLCSTKHPQTVSSLPSSLISLTFSSVISRMSAQDRDFSRLEALLCRLSTNSHAIPSFTS